jgi:hypothetical protein
MHLLKTFKNSTAMLVGLIFLLSFISMGQKATSEYISPWDEMYHMSYIQYVYEGHIPKQGDPMNTWSREGFSCKPVYPAGMHTGIPCGQVGPPDQYPEGGTNSASGWPPVYYSTVALLLKIPLSVSFHPIPFARVITAFLWSSGVALIALSGIRRKQNKYAILAVSLVISSLPFAYFHGSFVSPHSMIPLLVGGILSLDIEREKRNWGLRSSFFALLIFGVFSGLTVPQFSPIVGVVAFAWLVDHWKSDSSAIGRRVLGGTSILAAAGSTFVIYRIWGDIQSSRATAWPSDVSVAAGQVAIETPWTRASIMESIWRFFPHAIDQYMYLGPTEYFFSQSWSFVLLAATGALLFSSKGHFKYLAIGLVGFGIIYSVYAEWISVAPVPARYGISLVVLGFALIPNAIKTRGASLGILVLASFTYLYFFSLSPFSLS